MDLGFCAYEVVGGTRNTMDLVCESHLALLKISAGSGPDFTNSWDR
jgi:hypothetical protein